MAEGALIAYRSAASGCATMHNTAPLCLAPSVIGTLPAAGSGSAVVCLGGR